MKILSIIPARGGSKGIPHKNIYPVNGKPLIAWSIGNALGAECVNRVIVSTDDDRIAAVSIECGAEVIMRPEKISGDFASSESALIHVLNQLRKSENYIPDWVLFLQCTSPLLTSQDIDAAFAIVSSGDYDGIFSAYKQHFTGKWVLNDDGTMKLINYDPKNRPMRQETEQEYIENGAMYLLRTERLLHDSIRFGERNAVYVMPLERSFEIDEMEDVVLIEKLFVNKNQQKEKFETDDFENFKRNFQKIKLIVVDFDGTLTDNKVIVDEKGCEHVVCNRSDGLGVQLLKEQGFEIICLSTEKNPVVLKRCDKIKIECIHGVQDKASKLSEILVKRNLILENCVFIGNDLNDIPALKLAGIPIVVQDAHPEAKKYAKIVLKKSGGQGVILELAERIMRLLSSTKNNSI